MSSKGLTPDSKTSLGIAILAVSGTKAVAQFSIFAYVSLTGGLSQAGNLALAFAISGPIFVFLSMGIRTLILTHKIDFQLGSLEFVRFWTSALSLLLCLLLANLISPVTALTTFAIALTKVPDAFGEIYFSFMQKNHKISDMAFPQLLTTLSQTTIFLAIFSSSRSLVLAAVYSTLVAAILQFAYARKVCKSYLNRNKVKPQKITLKVLLHHGMASGLSDGTLSISVSFPTLVLSNVSSSETVAIYSFGMYLISGIELILNAVSQAWISRAKVLRDLGKLAPLRTFTQGAKWLPIVLITFAVGYFAIGTFLVEFSSQNNPIPSLPIAAILIVVFIEPFMFASSTALNVHNKYKSGLASSLIAFVAVAISSCILIPHIEIGGAFISLGILMTSRLITNQLILIKHFAAKEPNE